MMAKKKVAGKSAAPKKTGAKKSKKAKSAKRELITPKGDARYIRRDPAGQFDESDDLGKSKKSDRRKKAQRSAKVGQGDKGDRRYK
jgi:hypothetical protein